MHDVTTSRGLDDVTMTSELPAGDTKLLVAYTQLTCN